MPHTDQKPKWTWHEPVSATVVGLFAADELLLDTGASVAASTDAVGVLLDVTGFYATMGGQVTDLGSITKGKRSEEGSAAFDVTEAKVRSRSSLRRPTQRSLWASHLFRPN